MSDEEKIEALIDDYTTKYAIKHNVSQKEAKEHVIVKLATNYFKEDDNKNEIRSY